MGIYSSCCPYMGIECKDDCEFAVNGRCEYEEKERCPFFDGVPSPDFCSDCEYVTDDGCIFKKLNKISRELHELFPGLKCYVTDQGGLCIQSSIVNNINDDRIPDFEDTLNVDINPFFFNNGAARVIADVMLVDDGPACHYDSGWVKDDGTTEWEQVYPDQRFMINPECVLWMCRPWQKNNYNKKDKK